jgi:REP element-mobilizing transposase RayT
MSIRKNKLPMPRKARIDAPGALHHIICRGIERRKIFIDQVDRNDFLKRLGKVLIKTQTTCYAWSLMPNHFHLLLRTGSTPIATVMRKLLTGYVLIFNRRHRRNGYLFQNRYKSILCQEDRYLLELVRYIHLNPLRGKLVQTLEELDKYIYSGHSVIMRNKIAEWQDVDMVLGMFSTKVSSARRQYRKYVEKGIAQGQRPDLVGGGLIRSAGGWQAVKMMRKFGVHTKGDERILGGHDFVMKVLKEQNEKMEQRYRLQSAGYDIEKLVSRVADVFSLGKREVVNPSRKSQRVLARSVLCYWAIRKIGLTGSELSKILGIGQPAVSRAVDRGEKIVDDMKLELNKQ